MSESFAVNMQSTNVGTVSNTYRPIVKVPGVGGGISVVAANFVLGAAGTTALNLVNMGTAGTAVAGTIASKGSAVYVAGVPQACTIVTPFVDQNTWIGVEETNVGASNTITIVNFSYVQGK